MSNTMTEMTSEHIAVIGMAGRFPGARDIDKLWDNLCQGVESVTFFTKEELMAAGIEAEILDDPNYVRANAILDDIDLFDAAFFGFTPREAQITDPQHRLFLEYSWQALEHAGYNPDAYDGRIGVYAGANMSSYFIGNLLPNHQIIQSVSNFQVLMGNDKDYVSTRVSYKLNLKGPSVTVSTACSTSLVAVHLACQGLLDYHCDMALAGGVGIQLPQRQGYLYHEGGILSPDGHCRAFDARAGGTINGSGVGIVLLKRLEDAVADGDFIYAVIRGTAVNNDGSEKVGYTAPSVDGQTAVILEAQALAEIDPETITYIETHGTGTVLGDPIEIAALTQAFRGRTQQNGFCAIGSVKTNFGHLDAAAGIAGLIKTVLALHYKQIPPSLNFEQPNPKIDFASSPFYVNTTLCEWKTNGIPRRAGVSSFGIGGTNAHAVVEEFETKHQGLKSRSSRPWQLLTISARTTTALETATANLARYFKQHPDINLADAAYTLKTGRKAFSHRRIAIGRDVDEAICALESANPAGTFSGFHETGERPVLFMFSGQGAQYVNMARELYATEPLFRQTLEHCNDILQPSLDIPLLDILYPSQGSRLKTQGSIDQTAYTQPALFALEYTLATLWMSWGVQPTAMIGHSIGEYVAACLAGVFSLEDALALVAARGKLMQQLPAGAMLAVPLSEDQLLPYLDDDLSLATINGPSRCVVSGQSNAIERVQGTLEKQGIQGIPLRTSHAFHSAMMTPILEPFTEQVRAAKPQPPQIPCISNLTGTWLTPEDATDPAYWARHLRQTVRFSDGLQEILHSPDSILLEVGPGRTLATFARQHPSTTPDHVILTSVRHPKDEQSDQAVLLTTLGKLWVNGVPVNWAAFYANEHRRRLPLPTYPFERQRYWVESISGGRAVERQVEKVELVESEAGKSQISDWFYVPSWERSPVPVQSLHELLKTSNSSPWLVFLDECGLGERLATRLEQAGQTVIAIKAGAEFLKLNENRYVLSPEDPAGYHALFDELHSRKISFGRIVHLWNVTSNSSTRVDVTHTENAQSLGFYSLLFLVQALDVHNYTETLRLAVISSNLQEVTGQEPLCPEKATIIGPVRVIPQEYPNIWCQSIDIEVPATGFPNGERIIDRLAGECLTDHDKVQVVAYRGNYRWRQVCKPVRLGVAKSVASGIPQRLRTRGVYLITGGLGSMGLAFAKYLAQTVQAKLILTGRSAFPPQEEWAQWLRDDISHDQEIFRRYLDEAHFEALEQTGEEVEQLEIQIGKTLNIKTLAEYDGLDDKLRTFCAGLICRYFSQQGIELKNGKRYHREALRQRLRLLPKFEKFYDFFLHTLAENNIIRNDHDDILFTHIEDLEAPDQIKQAIYTEYPEFKGLVDLVDYCTRHYKPALCGEIEAIQVLYPEGNSGLLDQFFSQSIEHTNDRVYMTVLGEFLAQLAGKSKNRTLRILEVGGGTGGLTSVVLPALKTHKVEYYFTDVGKAFVINAEKEARKHGIHFMKFGVFDISKEAEKQGFERYSFDIIVGYNVVHATPDIAQTLQNLKMLLKPRGLLGLVETVRARCWNAMIWGLAEGWWHFSDFDIRRVSPLLTLDQWQHVLRQQGFRWVDTYPRDTANRTSTDAGLIIAQQPDDIDDSGYQQQLARVRKAKVLRIQEKIRRLQEIEKTGASVTVLRADVADKEQMQAAAFWIKEQFGELHGVIHTAGILGQGMLSRKTKGTVEQVFAPKVRGSLVLYQILQEMTPDFLILCSSLSSIFPIIGQIDYCAANAFLDAFASYAVRDSGIPTIAIDWGFWQELGMIEQAQLSQEARQQIQAEIRQKGLAEAGVDVFHIILAKCSLPQIIVSPEDIQTDAAFKKPYSLSERIGRYAPQQRQTASPLSEELMSQQVAHPLLGTHIHDGSGVEMFVTYPRARQQWVFDEHRVMGKAILPGTAYVEMARAAFEVCTGTSAVEIQDLYFLTPLILEDDQEKEVRTILKQQGTAFEFFVISRVGDDRWQEHTRGMLVPQGSKSDSTLNIETIKAECADQEYLLRGESAQDDVSEFETRLASYTGPRWKNMMWAKFGGNQGIALLKLPDEFVADLDIYGVHPALLDIATGFMYIKNTFEGCLPFSYRRMNILRPLPQTVYSYVRYAAHSQGEQQNPEFDITITDEQGTHLIEIEGYTLREVSAQSAAHQSFDNQPPGTGNTSAPENFYLEIVERGALDTLTFRPDIRRIPGPKEVEIDVQAAGLNFIEVLYALGMLPSPGRQVRFGLECAGTITRAGSEVEGLKVGDDVLAFSPAGFSAYALTPAMSVVPKPGSLSMEEGATIPAAFVTAYYALITMGRLRQGERILIHAAAGGVGLAAVMIAQWVGAEIFATAGNPEKREFLRSFGLPYVMDSRSLAFADDVMHFTDGQGVDVVLNSLGGEFIPKGLSLLRPYGRFLELGKRDFFNNTPLGLHPFARSLSFIAIDVSPEMPGFTTIFSDVAQRFEAGDFRPLPHRIFSITEIAEAFEYMAQAKHIGKIVIGFQDKAVLKSRLVPQHREGRPLHSIIGLTEPADTLGRKQISPVASQVPDGHDPGQQQASMLRHQRPEISTAYAAPGNETEEKLAEIWQALIGVDRVGIHDDFFELGGDSLLAAQVNSRVFTGFQVKLTLSTILQNPTVAALAERIAQVRESVQELATLPDIPLGEDEEEGEI